jgi:CMP-N-acetylneuraminic acid synthetase
MSVDGSNPRVVALVPMRHGSERAPGKNHRVFAGKPLCCWVIDALLESGVIDEILIDTDSPPVREICERYPAGVRVVDRPEELAGGMVSMNDVIARDLGLVDAGVVIQTHATNPLLRPGTIASALGAYCENLHAQDSLFTVTRRQTRFYSSVGQPLNHDPEVLERTQDLEPYYEENSCLYVFSPESFGETGRRIGRRPLMIALDPIESVDIDDERDFVLAESIARAGLIEGADAPVPVAQGGRGTERSMGTGSAA